MKNALISSHVRVKFLPLESFYQHTPVCFLLAFSISFGESDQATVMVYLVASGVISDPVDFLGSASDVVLVHALASRIDVWST